MDKATLLLYTTYSSATGYQVRSVTDQSWDEISITYANAPATGPVINSSGNFKSGNWISVDVSSLINGNGTYDLALTTTSTSSMSFNSRDASTNQPQLVIETTAGAVTATATGTAAPTFTNTPSPTPTSTAAPNPVLTFTPVADTYVESDLPTSNFGSSTQIINDNSPVKNMLLKFTVSGIGPHAIISAKLRLYCVNASAFGGEFHRTADTTWGEGSVNWNNAPVADATVLGTLGKVTASNWYEVDVTSLVTGDGTYSIRARSTSTDGAYYSSKEGTAGFAPQLVITTSASTPTSTLTPTSVATPTATLIPTLTSTPSDTPTPTDTYTPTITLTPSNTPIPTDTPTPSDTPAATFTPTPTNTATPSNTPTDTATPTATFTATNTATPSNTPTNTPTPSATPTLAATATPTPTSGSTTLTLNPVADSYVDTSNPTKNFGTATTIRVDGSPIVNSYLRFNVTGVGASSISQVRLLIFANSASSSGITAKTVADNTWGETTITASNAPAMGSTLGTSPKVVTGTWITLDVTSYVTGNGTFSFGVSTAGGTAISLASRKSGANAPQLIVDLH